MCLYDTYVVDYRGLSSDVFNNSNLLEQALVCRLLILMLRFF